MGKHSGTGWLGSVLRRRAAREPAARPDERRLPGAAERDQARGEDERQLRDIAYQRGGNQVRHEPMPASAHAEQRQDAVLRNAELGSASAARGEDGHQAWPAQGGDGEAAAGG